MWSKITHALRPRQAQESSQSQGEVLNRVFEQHPNLSVFNPNDSAPNNNSNVGSSPPPSPSKSGKRTMLKRLSKLPPKDDNEGSKSSTSLRLSKKSRPALNFNTVGSNSQLSLVVNSYEGQASTELSRRASFDVLHASQDSPKTSAYNRSPIDVLRRPSLDLLRNDSSQDRDGPQISPALEDRNILMTPAFNDKMGSVRSILRDPKTPGTGQNVRFFSRDAYKVISPEQSMDTEDQFFSQPPQPPRKDETTSFLDRLNQASPDGTSTPAVFRQSHNKSSSKSSRPSVSDLFSPLTGTLPLPNAPSQDEEQSMSMASPLTAKSTEPFDVSQSLDLPPFNPPGLDFDVNSFDQSINLDTSFDKSGDSQEPVRGKATTSTPFRAIESAKGKERTSAIVDPGVHDDSNALQVPLPGSGVDDSIFHGNDVPPRFPTPLHDRTQSFTLGQTVFYSMGEEESRNSSKISTAYASSDLKEPSISPNSSSSSKVRTRAISDTVLQNLLHSSTKTPPEADINDEFSDQLLVYSAPPVSEPDPFSAHASTYYTPQVMIPVTPPQNSKHHIRKTSKEESLIYSLQTQLSIQNDLCQQYEVDLRARDEMVATLTQKLADAEKEDGKRRATLRTWKKKVQELERACRQLEDEVDTSRQMSFERSVMDEASGEALRMLHRQIAALEREKGDQLKREEMLKEEIAHLEDIVKDRSEDVSQLKEMLWSRDENERELATGLREAKEQMDQLANVSVVIDEEEMRRLMSEKEQALEDTKTRQRMLEITWQQEREELVMKVEGLEVEKGACEEEIEKTKQQLKSRDEEFEMLKSELEAQWTNTETMSNQIEALKQQKVALENEKEQIQKTVEELENRINNMELEWNENENKKDEFENQLQEMWHVNEALQKDREQMEYDLHQAEERLENVNVDLQRRDEHLTQLEEEVQFNKDLVTRAQESLRKRDEEINEYTNRVVEKEAQVESLREQLSSMTREYNRLLDEQSRADRSISNQEAEMKTRIEEVVKQKAEVDVQLKTARDQVAALQDEIERLRRQLHTLKQTSADDEVEINRLKKQHASDKEDIFGLNMALDAKQQELELIKRQMGVRGTAGATPAKSSSGKVHRRDSSIFTATPVSRPPSAASESIPESASAVKSLERKQSAERPASSASASRPSTALGRSSRANASASGKSSVGSMGPPPNLVKPRPSVSSVGTPTPTAKPLGRSSSTRPSIVSPTGTPLPHRRVSSAIATLEQRAAASTSSAKPTLSKAARVTSPVSSVPERDEKENVDDAAATPTASSRRRVAVPM